MEREGVNMKRTSDAGPGPTSHNAPGKDDKKDGGGLFSGLGGMSGALKKAIPLITALGTAGLAAGVAFAGFKVGGEINKGINKMVSFLTGKEGETFGGWLYDITHPDEGGGKRLSGDKAFMRGGQLYKGLQQAKKAGFKVTAKTTRGEFEEFNKKRIEKNLEAKKKASLQEEVEKADNRVMKAKKAQKDKEMSVFERMTDDEAIAKITAQALKELNINVGGGGVSKLDTIPSNSDDLQLAYSAKGGAS